jgi:hypothetical protein
MASHIKRRSDAGGAKLGHEGRGREEISSDVDHVGIIALHARNNGAELAIFESRERNVTLPKIRGRRIKPSFLQLWQRCQERVSRILLKRWDGRRKMESLIGRLYSGC